MGKQAKKSIQTAGLILFIGILSFPVLAHAAEAIVQCGGTNADGTVDVCGWGDLIETLNRLLKYAILFFAVPVSVIVIILGGLRMIFSMGNESKFKQGKDMVQGVAVGLAITFGAWIIVQTIINIFFSGSG